MTVPNDDPDGTCWITRQLSIAASTCHIVRANHVRLAVAKRPAKTPVLFMHIGWAREYLGARSDRPVGKFGYLKERNDEAGEARNFLAVDGRCYGYAAVKNGRINLTRLGASSSADHVDGVLVIWTATDPGGSGRFIVGWYRNARVYAERRSVYLRGSRSDISVEAVERDCYLVPELERCFEIRSRETGWPGTSPAFFASDTLPEEHLVPVLEYVANPNTYLANTTLAANDTQPSENASDAAHKAIVEEKSIALVTTYFQKKHYSVVSVESENRGWDLEARLGKRTLLIEVKGRSNEGTVELTPNEFRAMCDTDTRMSYRLAIVHKALSNKPKLTLFSYAPSGKIWVSSEGRSLMLEELRSARATVL